MRLKALLTTLAATAVLASILAIGSRPATVHAKAPEITFMFPKEGGTYAEPLKVLQMCFSEPINVKDLDKGGDFRFRVNPPNGPSLGLRIVFQPNGLGVAVYPGPFDGDPEGEWTFEWRVTDAATLEPLDSKTKYSVQEGGEPILQPTPVDCPPGGAPQPSRSAEPDGTPRTSPGNTITEEHNGPDVLLLALLTTGAAAGAGLIALVGYVIRNRVGFWLHRPPERNRDD